MKEKKIPHNQTFNVSPLCLVVTREFSFPTKELQIVRKGKVSFEIE